MRLEHEGCLKIQTHDMAKNMDLQTEDLVVSDDVDGGSAFLRSLARGCVRSHSVLVLLSARSIFASLYFRILDLRW